MRNTTAGADATAEVAADWVMGVPLWRSVGRVAVADRPDRPTGRTGPTDRPAGPDDRTTGLRS
ncbi:hypothetical protein GCM10027215_01880 [Nocardioides zeae]